MEFQFLEEAESQTSPQQNAGGLKFEYIQGAQEVNVEPSGFLRQAADIPIQFAKGIGTGTRGLTDIFGADNPVSKTIAGYEDYMDDLLSAESKNDSAYVARRLQEAKDGGFLDKITAGFEAFSTAPLETTANVVGYMVPQLAAGVAGKAAQLGKAAQVGLTLGTSLAQGAGTAKGDLYQNTKLHLREIGVPEDKIEPAAVEAQAWNGKNLDNILGQAGLNAIASRYGAEAILTRVLTKQGKEVSGGIIGGILKGAGKEMPLEGLQGAYEEVTKNVGLQRMGYDVPTFQGAIESATTGIVAGGVVGGAAGGIEAISAEQKELNDIEKEANRKIRDLEADSPAAQALSTEITRLERGIDNKRQDLDTLESTSQEASKARLDIAADQKKLAVLKVEAAKFGLSEPIAEIEKQQAALAGEIAAPAEPTVKESLTVQPTEAAPAKPIVTEEPPVSMVGKEVIPGVTPIPVVRPKAPVEQVVTPPVKVAPTIAEAAPVEPITPAPITEEGVRTALEIVPQEVLEVFSENQPLMERIRKDALEKKGGSLQTYITTSVRTKGVQKSQIQSIANKVVKQLGESPTIAEVEDAVTNEVENIASFKEKKKSDEIKLQSALQRTGETYELDTAIQDYKNKQIELERAQKSMLITPALRQMERVGAKNNLEKSKQNLIAIAAKSAPVTEQAAPAEAPAPEVAKPTGGVDYYKQLGEQDALDTNRKKKRSVPQNFKLAYENGWSAAKRKAREEAPTPAVSETIAEPVQRDVTKPEQMTPEEQEKFTYESHTLSPKVFAEVYRKLPLGEQLAAFEYDRAANIADTKANILENKSAWEAAYNQAIRDLAEKDIPRRHKAAFGMPISKRKPVSSSAVDAYGITLPAGYTKQGELYVYQPAVSETIAEPVQRDVTKPEQMTPEEYGAMVRGVPVTKDMELEYRTNDPYALSYVRGVKASLKSIIQNAIDIKNPVSSISVDLYNIPLPEGYVKQGELYVYQPEDIRKTVVGDTQYQTEGVIPEDQRFTEDELRVIVNDIFGGKIPDKIEIITDTTDPNKEFKAAYSIRRGTITYNLAYIAKEDDIGFVTNHELGHFIMGDPKFQVEMARLFDSLPSDIQEKLKVAIDEAYAQESIGVRAEELIVFAFGEILENAPDGRNILQRFLDAIRDAINRLFKTEGYIPRNPKKAAAAILMAARNRFEQGEFIRRPNGSILMMTPTSTKDLMRDAEYLAAVERGDMETAQRMVDEAAKKAGYDIGPVMHGTSRNFTKFEKTMRGAGNTLASKKAFWFTTDEVTATNFSKLRTSAGGGSRIINAYLKGKFATSDFSDIPNWNTAKSHNKRNEVVQRAIRNGKDGVHFKNMADFGPSADTYAVFEPEQIKSADPVTYDDAGNVIPLSQRFQPSEPDIRRMAVKKGQVASIKNAGAEKKTPKQIIARTRELLRKDFFNPAEVTEQNTLTAFRALGKLVGPKKQAASYAEELNDIGRLVDEEGVASEVSMGAILFTNDLFEYSIKLAAEGQKMMLGIMMSNMNKLPLGEGLSLEESARSMRGALERSTRFTMMGKAEQDAFANYVAEFIYGPNPSKEQIQSIKDAYAKVEKTPQVTEQELTDEIKAVGDRTGTDLVGKINEEFTKATEKKTQQRKTEEEELDTEYKKVQKQADAEIEKLAKIQSDTPSFDPATARQTANDVRAIVANDLKQRPDMGRKAPWKSMLVAKLQEAGVELTAAETLADIVWRQHEINNLSRELSSINKAIEKGPISEIIKAIKDTPLEEQQNPNWRYEVMRDYLRKAGLPLAQAERIAKLMDISLQKRFTMAQEEAFTQAISKSAPWKSGDTRSRRAFQKVLQALRAGALDPARNVLSDMAALNGWTGFTPEQYKDLLKYDAILADPKTTKADLAEAHKAIQNIISKAKLPIRARDVIGQYYDAQALSGITTMTVNIFSPAGMAARNALVQSLNGLVTARPEQITAAMTTFVDSIKSWANTVAYSFKNNVTVYSNVEYLVNDEGLLKLYERGVDQFNNGKTSRDRADGVKNMMVGMMDYVRRILNALDYGAIASLQNQAVSKYALAVMQAKGMSSADGTKMLNAMFEQKRIFYNDQIAIGTDKNKAAVLADEFFISAWEDALTKEGVEKSDIKKAMDAALNDAMSAVGRNRQSLDAFMEEETNIRDEGLLSFPAIWLLETIANAANKQDSQFIKIFSRIIYGFAIVPARVLREAAWFSPLAAHRFAYEYIAKKKGLKSRYAQSLGNDLQYRQRLTETITGTIVMLAFGAAMSASTDDEEDKKPFKIVVTGNGPLRNEDPQFHDSWVKKNRANTVSVYFGKTKFTLNTMRGFEAFAWPAMMLGAVDDWHIRRKQKRTTNTPLQMQDAAIVAGNVLSASLRRGPYAFAAKPLFEAHGDRGVESLARSLAFPAKTMIPVLGSSLAKNISDFLNEPMDRRTLEGALWSNVPFIGPTVAPKSLNAFGEPALATDAADKIFKLGVPIVYDIPNDRNSIMVHELVLKQGGGPSIPNRSQLAKRLDREPTNKEFEMFVREYGAEIKRVMTENIEELSAMSGPDYDRAMEYIGNNARDAAQVKLMEAKKP